MKINVDGKEVDVPDESTVLEACHRAGADVPHFCYHPGLPNAANCRMCLVQIEGWRKPVPSCNVPVTPNMKITTKGPTVDPMRKAVLEFLLINHPLDCPICDKAGECMLQDNYFRYSRKPSVMRDPKVHKPKKESVNDRIIYDGERCILCSRCVRFSDSVSKTKQIGIEERGDHAIVSFPKTGPYDDPYSDNVVDICPVGALTSKKFRFNARVWNLKVQKGVCFGCSRNCNVEVHHNNNRVHRVLPRYSSKINKYWMCNAGRDVMTKQILDFRVKAPMKKGGDGYEIIDWGQGLAELVSLAKQAKKPLIIGSRYLTNQEWWSLKKFQEKYLPAAAISLTVERVKDFDEVDQDDILIRSDKHPNTYTAKKYATTESTDHSGYDFILDFTESLKEGISSQAKLVRISFFRDYVDQRADLLLPLAHPLEKSGTYTNFEGINSSFEKSLTVVDSAKSLDEAFKEFVNEQIPTEFTLEEVSNLPAEEMFPNVVNPEREEGYLFRDQPVK